MVSDVTLVAWELCKESWICKNSLVPFQYQATVPGHSAFPVPSQAGSINRICVQTKIEGTPYKLLASIRPR